MAGQETTYKPDQQAMPQAPHGIRAQGSARRATRTPGQAPPARPRKRGASQLIWIVLICSAASALLVANVAVPSHGWWGRTRPETTSQGTDETMANTRSPNVDKRLESAVELLQAGRMEGGQALLDLAAGSDKTVAGIAAAEWSRVGVPMAEAVGCVLAWPAADKPPTPKQVAAARSFWERRATPRLLADTLDRLAGRDWRWTKINSMLARRDWLYKTFR